MNQTTIPNTSQIEAVSVESGGDRQFVRHERIIGWMVDQDGEALPITTDYIPEAHGLHDRATGRAWIPGEQNGELHQTLSCLGWDSAG